MVILDGKKGWNAAKGYMNHEKVIRLISESFSSISFFFFFLLPFL